MNAIKTFYLHESESRIMMNKDKAEVDNWMDDLEYIKKEVEYLLDIEDKIVNNPKLHKQIQASQKENKLRLRRLRRYRNIMQNELECDTVECDAFYLNKHEKNRNLYVEHVKKYRDMKSNMLSKILQTAKK